MKKKSVIFWLIVLLNIIATVVTMAQLNEKKYEYKIQADKAKNLKVDLLEGDIKIMPWDKNEIAVQVDDNSSKADEVLNISYDENDLKISTKPENMDYSKIWIMLPSEFNIDLQTNSGDISIAGEIIGNVKGTTLGGDVLINQAKGTVDLNTNGGDAKAGDITGSLRLNTLGGDVLAGTVSGACSLSTNGGDIRVSDVGQELDCKTFGGDINTGRIGGKAKITTFGGTITAKALLQGAEMNTYGGDIYVDEGRGLIQAKTAGGIVKMKKISGSINIKSASGDIFAELYPSGQGESYINAVNGEIRLSLPEDAKASINAVMTVFGNPQENETEGPSIKSDFTASSQPEEIESGFDIPVKKREKNFELGGGGHKITIKTMNGDITIRKITK